MVTQYYAHGETCASFCIKLWLDYILHHKRFDKDCFKMLPIMVALCQLRVHNKGKELSIMLNAFGDLLCSTVNIILA